MKIKIDNFYKTLEEIKEKIKTEKASASDKICGKKSGIEQELSLARKKTGKIGKHKRTGNSGIKI